MGIIVPLLKINRWLSDFIIALYSGIWIIPEYQDYICLILKKLRNFAHDICKFSEFLLFELK